MKKTLLLTIFFNAISFVCHAQYDVDWNTCILFCNDGKSADEAKFENQRDQCRQGCYCVVAIGMTDIMVVPTSSVYSAPPRNEVTSSEEYKSCLAECLSAVESNSFEIQMNYMACRAGCCARYPDDCVP